MLGQNTSQPALFQIVDIESLGPKNHRLHQIDAALDLSFVREAVAACYAPSQRRPSIDPEPAVRMMLLGTLYDLSGRQVSTDGTLIQVNAGMQSLERREENDEASPPVNPPAASSAPGVEEPQSHLQSWTVSYTTREGTPSAGA